METTNNNNEVQSLTISKDLMNTLLALQIAASTDVTRFDLQGVFLDVKNKTLVATNGHYLMMQENLSDSTLEEFKPFHNKVFTIEKGKPSLLGSHNFFFVQNNWISETGYRIDIIQGAEFPDYRQVIPNKKASLDSIGFDGNYLSDINKAMSLASGIKKPHLSFTFSGALDAVKITGARENFSAVLMPVRITK